MRLGGLILTGGHSRRMGRPKEWLPFHGDTLLGRAAAELRTCTCPTAVVARDAQQQLPPLVAGVERIGDLRPGLGPLAAMHTGLCWLRDHHGFGPDDAAFVTACDLPFIDRTLVAWLAARLGDAPCLMPSVEGHAQPLVAIYRTRLVADIETMLEAGCRSPRDLGRTPGCRVVTEAELRDFDASLRCLVNVNDPHRYSLLLGDADRPPPGGDPLQDHS